MSTCSYAHEHLLIRLESEFLDRISANCEQILLTDPSARLIIAGDINQLKIRDFCNQFNLEQLVKKSTRGHRILDVFLTNQPHLWNQPTVFKGLVRSDHLAVMVTPRIQAKPERKHVYFRDVRQHRKIDMENKSKFFDWSKGFSVNDVEEAVLLLNQVISLMFNESFPQIKVKTDFFSSFMMKQKRTSPGPDGLPYWLWKEYANYLAPVLTYVLNLSLHDQCVPSLWKLANIRPIMKESTLSDCSQLRPISLTNIIMRLFEKIVFQEEIEEHFKSIINNDQFAYKKGSNTTAALIKCQYHWLKWLDEDADFIRVLSFGFSKAFDSVPHNVVTERLKQTNLNPYIINWIISFLTKRKQRVVVDGFITEYANINRGVPQGTVIGLFLFSLTVEDIKPKQPEINKLIKFADDMTVSAPVRSNKNSSMEEVKHIENWAARNRMTLNLSKTWDRKCF